MGPFGNVIVVQRMQHMSYADQLRKLADEFFESEGHGAWLGKSCAGPMIGANGNPIQMTLLKLEQNNLQGRCAMTTPKTHKGARSELSTWSSRIARESKSPYGLITRSLPATRW